MGRDAFSLTDRVALVTGGNGGLGCAIAFGLRAAGASIAVTGRDQEKNAAVAAELGDRGAVFSLDVRDEIAVERTVTGIVRRFGRLDILVTCAGDFAGGSALDLPLADWERVLASHFTGTFLCARHAARAMAARGEGGKIVTVGSMYHLLPKEGLIFAIDGPQAYQALYAVRDDGEEVHRWLTYWVQGFGSNNPRHVSP